MQTIESFETVVEHFGGIPALASALGISTKAIYQWDGVIPELRAHEIEKVSGGRFTFEMLPTKRKK